MCIPVHLSLGNHKGTQTSCAEIADIVSHPARVQGASVVPSARAGCSLNHRAISSTPLLELFKEMGPVFILILASSCLKRFILKN